MTRFIVLALALALTSQAQAQVITQITLDDGTILIGKIAQNIELQTKFGKLTLPPQDIVSGLLGYNLTDDESKEVTKAFKELDSAVYKQREAASLYLKTIGGRALPLMPKIYGGIMPEADPKDAKDAKDAPLESKRRVEQWLRDTKPDQKYLHDEFNTEEGSFKGKIITKQINLQHGILGDLKVDVARIKTIGSFSNIETTVNADAEWKEVVTIHCSNKVTISASGIVDLWPATPGQHFANPKGSTTAGKNTSFMAGALIGKLGNGLPFLVGDSYTVSQPGRLYLKIVENPWNGVSSGQYAVKIERR